MKRYAQLHLHYAVCCFPVLAISWIVPSSKSDRSTKIERERSQVPDMYICKEKHLQELAGKTHKPTTTARATTLVLHVHLKCHLGSRVNGRLLVSGL